MPDTLNPDATPLLPATLTSPANGDSVDASSGGVQAPFQSLLDGLHNVTAGALQSHVLVAIKSTLVADPGSPDDYETAHFDLTSDDANYAALTFASALSLGTWGIDVLDGDIAEIEVSGFFVYEEVQGGNGFLRIGVQNGSMGGYLYSGMRYVLPQLSGAFNPVSSGGGRQAQTYKDTITYGADTLTAAATIRVEVANIAQGACQAVGPILCTGRLWRPRGT